MKVEMQFTKDISDLNMQGQLLGENMPKTGSLKYNTAYGENVFSIEVRNGAILLEVNGKYYNVLKINDEIYKDPVSGEQSTEM